MSYSQSVKLLLIAFVITLLSSCGGGSSNSSDNISQDSRVVSGVAQKGPFSLDSLVVISLLDSVGSPTGEVINTKVSSKTGEFEFQVPNSLGNSNNLTGNFYIEVQGKVFDESSGTLSSSKLTLSAYTQEIDANSVNLMTHWAAERVKVLLAEGKPLDQSVKQAEQELEKTFGIAHANNLDITNDELPADSVKLLLLSGVLMDVARDHSVEPQQIIDEISNNPNAHAKKYAKQLKEQQSIETISVNEFPAGFPLASRPVANVPSELLAEPGETIILDGSASHDSGNIINFTWFRVDQQTQYAVPVSDRFAASPTITTPSEEEVLAAPNEEIALLYALVVTDEDKLTHTGVVKVIVKKPPEMNIPPVADPQQLTTDEDVPLKITLTGSDEDGDSIEFNLATPQSLAHGILELDPDFGSVLPYVLYTPTSNFNGTDSFNFLVNDGFDSSAAAKVDILINPVNDPPVAIPQSVTTLEDVPVDIVLTGSDIENDTLVFSIDSIVPQNGSLTGTPPNLTYTPNSLFSGNDQFNFIVNDGSLDSAPSLVTITVESTNIPPTAIATLNVSQPIEEMTELVLFGGESFDDDGNIVSYLWEQIGTPLVTLSSSNVANPTFTTPSVASTPLILTFRLTVTDNDGATNTDIIDIEVVAIANNPPTANAGLDQTVTTGESVTLQGSGIDSDGSIIAYQWSHSYEATVSLIIPNTPPTAHAGFNREIVLVVTEIHLIQQIIQRQQQFP
ncbi:Dyslexia-associated protein KIAA0319 [Nymphon striatum]|nr:Dyslexia-associated protein KIAA0319 [Nymphon striatum]